MADGSIPGIDSRTGQPDVLRGAPIGVQDFTNLSDIADDGTLTIGTLTSSRYQFTNGVYLLTVNDGTIKASAFYMIQDNTIFMSQDSSNSKFDDADTDAKMCLYVDTGSLIFKNRGGGTVAAGAMRLIRIA